MDFNAFVFPAPKPSWNYNEYLGELLWIPAKKDGVDQDLFNQKVIEKAEKVNEVIIRDQIQAFYPMLLR